ncbi:hypothetical protein E4U17_005215 [Claviceps sp. LM77 group G4]|nr:hypothetical protein E4U17_005215 [Claviceps sp. LM77 group G4]KAG6066245.1 hypothetical protein E4U16_000287 [Claviceps sp. LM84 group G4]KAG6067133.1 hypothetical protein E4U33_005367 [Claviceps sp. LM78 group G4]
MAVLTISTGKAPSFTPSRRGSTSPVPPPMSPITPPLAPTPPDDAADAADSYLSWHSRQPLKHSSQSWQQMGIPPPPPEPIDFDSNPDVIALKSAISVLQVQKARAVRDIQTLNKVRKEALADPDAFITDLADGNVKAREDFVFGGSDDSDQDSEDKEDDEDDEEEDDDDYEEPPVQQQQHNHKSRPWSALPRPQEVVRCPQINWAQYAVVGGSLDKLHAEQLSHPSPGQPAVFGPGGLYTVSGEGAHNKTHSGVVGPYEPGRDGIDRKLKSKK